MRPLHSQLVQVAGAHFRQEDWCPRAQHWTAPSLEPASGYSDPWLHAQADRPPELVQTGFWDRPLTEPVETRACSAPSPHARADKRSDPLQLQERLWSFDQALPAPLLKLRVCNAPSRHVLAGRSPAEASIEPV